MSKRFWIDNLEPAPANDGVHERMNVGAVHCCPLHSRRQSKKSWKQFWEAINREAEKSSSGMRRCPRRKCSPEVTHRTSQSGRLRLYVGSQGTGLVGGDYLFAWMREGKTSSADKRSEKQRSQSRKARTVTLYVVSSTEVLGRTKDSTRRSVSPFHVHPRPRQNYR